MAKYSKEVAVGALLHDIGKLYMRAGNTVRGVKLDGGHSIVGANAIETHFKDKLNELGLNVDLIKEIVQRHHEGEYANSQTSVKDASTEYRPICKLVSNADNKSSSERFSDEEKEGKHWVTTPLTHIFSLGVNKQKINHKIGIFEDTFIKASSQHTSNTAETNTKFVEEFTDKIKELDTSNFENFFSDLIRLLREYTWCFTSDYKQLVPDVSLFNHLVTTSAIATATYKEFTSDDKYHKGMRSPYSEAGCEFMMACFTPKNHYDDTLGIFSVRLRNTEDYMLSNIEDLTHDHIEWVKSNKLMIDTYTNNLIDSIISLGYTSASVINNGENLLFIVTRSDREELFKAVALENKRLMIESTGKVYFESAYIDLTNESISMHETHLVINEVSKFKASDSVEVRGIEDVVTSNGKWLATKDIFNDVASKNSTIRRFEAVELESKKHKTLAMIEFNILGLDKLLDGVFKVDDSTMNKLKSEYVRRQKLMDALGESEEFINETGDSLVERDYGSMSRYATANRNIIDMMNLRYAWATNVLVNRDKIVTIIPLCKAFEFVEDFKTNILDKLYLKSDEITVCMSMRTFQVNDDFDSVFKQLKSDSLDMLRFGRDKLAKTILPVKYNGISLTWEQFNQIEEYIAIVRSSYKMGSAPVYRLAEYISMYKTDKSAKSVMCVPRFFYDKTRNYKNGVNIYDRLNKFVTEQFENIENGSETSIFFDNLDVIIKDAISIEIRG